MLLVHHGRRLVWRSRAAETRMDRELQEREKRQETWGVWSQNTVLRDPPPVTQFLQLLTSFQNYPKHISKWAKIFNDCSPCKCLAPWRMCLPSLSPIPPFLSFLLPTAPSNNETFSKWKLQTFWQHRLTFCGRHGDKFSMLDVTTAWVGFQLAYRWVSWPSPIPCLKHLSPFPGRAES